MPGISYIGSTLSAVASTPATEDASGYGALSLTEIGLIVDIGAVGDTSEDITINLLKTGRTKHVNGAKDLGEIAVTVEFDKDDTGQDLIRTASNGNTTHSFGITDTDGVTEYFQGVVANYQTSERNASAYKGATFVIRGQTGIVTVEA